MISSVLDLPCERKNPSFSSAGLSLTENKMRSSFVVLTLRYQCQLGTINTSFSFHSEVSSSTSARPCPCTTQNKVLAVLRCHCGTNPDFSSCTRNDKVGKTARPLTGSTYSTTMPSRGSP